MSAWAASGWLLLVPFVYGFVWKWAQRATGAEQARNEYQVAIKPEWRA